MKATIMSANGAVLNRVYTQRQHEGIEKLLGEKPGLFVGSEAPGGDEEFIFSTWGIPKIDVSKYPNLKAVFYGAGSVQTFARNLFAGNIRLFSAWKVNAVSVAEFTFSEIILSLKGAFREMAVCAKNREEAKKIFTDMPGAYRTRVGLLGLGAIGSLVAERLKSTDVEVCAYDPFVSEERAKELGVTLMDISEIFKTASVISNHIANLPATVGIIKREYLMSMLPNATFINTGRGAQLNEQDLFDALTQSKDRCALLDVVTDEKNFDDCVLRDLPNCFFTPHVAGASGNEVERMGQRMVDNLALYLKNEKIGDEVTEKMLETLA